MRKPAARQESYQADQMSRSTPVGSPIRLPAPIVGYEPRNEANRGALERLEAENAGLRKIASVVMTEIKALRRLG
jgi:hypothetical protein